MSSAGAEDRRTGGTSGLLNILIHNGEEKKKENYKEAPPVCCFKAEHKPVLLKSLKMCGAERKQGPGSAGSGSERR